MISRFYVGCPGCSSKILLRLSVGRDTEQPFYYVCNKCNLATRGKLVIWYTPSPGGKLELEDGQEIGMVENPDQVINIHPDLPAIPGAKEMSSLGGSPFLMHHQLLKDKFEEFLQRLNSFREGIDTNWKSVRRMIGYYLDRNWEQFDNQGERILKENWTKINLNILGTDTILLDNLFNHY